MEFQHVNCEHKKNVSTGMNYPYDLVITCMYEDDQVGFLASEAASAIDLTLRAAKPSV